MIYLVPDLSTKFFTPNCYVNLVVASVEKESILKGMGFEDEPFVCAISDPEVVKLINEELGSNFEPANVEALMGEDDEVSWVIPQVTDGKIQWFSVWIE